MSRDSPISHGSAGLSVANMLRGRTREADSRDKMLLLFLFFISNKIKKKFLMRKSDRDREEVEGTASGDRAGQQELHPVAGIIIFILFYFRPFLVFSFHFILFHLFCFIFFFPIHSVRRPRHRKSPRVLRFSNDASRFNLDLVSRLYCNRW